jgi:phosphatidylserine/phosphatidylglycerophosphate/cardiolipin synthase-like enzyme
MHHVKNKIIVFVLVWWISNVLSFPEVYFSPDDNVRSKLITLIRQEQDSIKMAVYLITDKGIVEELGKAKERGVEVEVVADVLSVDKNWGKVLLLKEYDIPVYVYDGGSQSIMHNKFFIFTKNKDDKKLLWTGSYNPTQKADRYNRENVIIEDNESMITAFEHEFNRLKKISRRVHHRAKHTQEEPATQDQIRRWKKYVELTVTELIDCLNKILW